MLGVVDERRQCGWVVSIQEAFFGTQHSSLLGRTLSWSELLTFGPFQERGRERKENVYPYGITDLDAWCPIHSWTVLTVKLCMQTPGFLGANAALAVAFEDPQQTLCMPAITDRNNFVQYDPKKDFSIGIYVFVLSFKNQEKVPTIILYLILPYIPFKYISIFLILSWKRSGLLPCLFNGEMTYRYFPVSLFYVPGYPEVLKSKG